MRKGAEPERNFYFLTEPERIKIKKILIIGISGRYAREKNKIK